MGKSEKVRTAPRGRRKHLGVSLSAQLAIQWCNAVTHQRTVFLLMVQFAPASQQSRPPIAAPSAGHRPAGDSCGAACPAACLANSIHS